MPLSLFLGRTHCTHSWHRDWDEGHGGDKVLSSGLNVEGKNDKRALDQHESEKTFSHRRRLDEAVQSLTGFTEYIEKREANTTLQKLSECGRSSKFDSKEGLKDLEWSGGVKC